MEREENLRSKTRLHNPGSVRERNLVNVHRNPDILQSLFASPKRKKIAEAKAVFERFRGTASTKSRLIEARPGTPSDCAELGGLREIALDARSVSSKAIRRLKLQKALDKYGDVALSFDPKSVKLAGDAQGDLHIVGLYIPGPEGLEKGRLYKLGDVVAVTYKSSKPHIEGNNKRADYEHEFNEDGRGENPRLNYKDGYLFFSGGTYKLLAEGISG